MNNIAAIKPFNFVLAPMAAHKTILSLAVVVAAQIVFFALGMAVSHPLGVQMQALKSSEAMIFAAYLIGGCAFSSALYTHNKRYQAAIVASGTLTILSFLGGLLLA